MKKLCVIMSVMMLLTFSLSSIAYAGTTDLPDKAHSQLDVQALLKQAGDVSNVTIDKNEKSYKVTYNDGDINYFNEKKYANGNIRYTIKGGDITNVIDVKGSQLYLDGEQVLYSENTADSVVGPMTVNTYINSTSPQASNYSVSDGYSDTYVQLPDVLQNVLKGSIITLIGYVNVYAGLAAFVFDAAYSIIKAANPNTTKLYYRKYCWEYSGNDPLTGMLFYKYKTNWYTTSARTTLAESKTTYTTYVL